MNSHQRRVARRKAEREATKPREGIETATVDLNLWGLGAMTVSSLLWLPSPGPRRRAP